ncbi:MULTISPECIES: hypothetical protein [Bacillus cereus group]|uniref:hypothetical protein n=1 Tax=Bacillus cereus group TaxID=86661 RepID=UPI000BEC0488|nr:hypothetical protein [Bacillus cereus]PDY83579.1 hypothetical protein CON06_07930 [Bacillus cereus]
MSFWMNTLSGTIGSFVGVLGAMGIAKWQMNKTQKLGNNSYYLHFNIAQIYIDRFDNRVEEILSLTEGAKRRDARILLHKHDYIKLKEDLELAIKTVNKDMTDINFEKFPEELGKINQNAPLIYYKDLNFIYFSMAIIYNLLIQDARYLVDELPNRIGIDMNKNLSSRFMLKKFRSRYKKMKKKLKV